MDSQLNQLHQKIGAILSDMLKDRKNVVLLRDKACGGNQHIPLFCTSEKSRETEYCNVDLMVLKNNRVKIIIEIEESNVKPTQEARAVVKAFYSTLRTTRLFGEHQWARNQLLLLSCL